MSEKKQLHLGVFLQGVGHTIAWRHPEHAKFTEFETYVRFAQTAERGKFDFIFFGEGLVVREHQGRFFGPIVNGRPDTIALLPALAAVTEKIGLAATISSTYNAPYELARQLASIDHVSNGRAAWNVVTTFSNSAAKDSGGDQVAYNFSKEKHLDHATRNSSTASRRAGPWSAHRRRSPITSRPGSRPRPATASSSPRHCFPATSTTSWHSWCPSCNGAACSVRSTQATRCAITSDSSALPCRPARSPRDRYTTQGGSTMSMPLSVLDLSPIPAGGTAHRPCTTPSVWRSSPKT